MAEIKGRGQFGVSLTGAQSLTKNKTCDTAELRDENGEVVGLALYNKREEITAQVIMSSGANAPAVGDAFQGGIITAVSENETNTGFRMYSVTAVAYSGISASE